MSLELPRIVALTPSATGFVLTWQPPSSVSSRIVSHYKIGFGEEDIFSHEERVQVPRDKRPPYTFQARNLRECFLACQTIHSTRFSPLVHNYSVLFCSVSVVYVMIAVSFHSRGSRRMHNNNSFLVVVHLSAFECPMQEFRSTGDMYRILSTHSYAG